MHILLHSKNISNELKLKNLVQDNIVILKYCDAIKGMAIGVLQEAVTQICRWGWQFPMLNLQWMSFFRQNLKTKIKQICTPDPFGSRFNAVILFLL